MLGETNACRNSDTYREYLKGTKCFDCTHMDAHPLETAPDYPCSRCVNRPTRKRDKSFYQSAASDVLDIVADGAAKGTKYDY